MSVQSAENCWKPVLKMVDHSLQVYYYRFWFHISLVPEDFHRLAIPDPLPVTLMSLHKSKDGPEYLPEHGSKVLTGVFGIMDLDP